MKHIIKIIVAMLVSVYSMVCNGAVIFFSRPVIVSPNVVKHSQQVTAQPSLSELWIIIVTVFLIYLAVIGCIFLWRHYSKKD